MALYTDGPPSSIDDLSAQDSQLLSVATTEQIDVTQKLALAHEQVGIEVEALLRRMIAAGYRTGIESGPNLGGVVVTKPVKLWHTFVSLKLVYGDAYYNQLNDRYGHKRDDFEQQAKWAYEKVLAAGLGIARSPLPQAATPTVTGATGALAAGTYYVSTCWVNATGEEGAPSIPASYTVTNQTLLVQAGTTPANATGWNVYVGTAPDQLTKQNGAPVAPGGAWLQPGVLATSTKSPGDGQKPSYFYPVPRLIQRG